MDIAYEYLAEILLINYDVIVCVRNWQHIVPRCVRWTEPLLIVYVRIVRVCVFQGV